MAKTGVKTGLTPSRLLGSGVNNVALEEHPIANQLAETINLGDPVKLAADGTIVKATNGDPAVGVFLGAIITNSSGHPVDVDTWVSGTDSESAPVAKVLTDPAATFTVKADGDISAVEPGDIMIYDFNTSSAKFGRSAGTVQAIPGDSLTGMLRVRKIIDLGENALEVSFAKHEYRDNA